MTRPEETLRAFVAFELPDTVLKAVGDVQEQMRRRGLNARWVPPGNIHLTLKFLGDIPVRDVERISRCLRTAALNRDPICLAAKGAGVFPGVHKPRVIWVGLKDTKNRLLEFHKTLEACLEGLGYPSEGRPFKGHLTVGRFKKNPSLPALMDVLEMGRGFETEPFILDAVVLFRSDLKPSGPVYSKLAVAALGKDE